MLNRKLISTFAYALLTLGLASGTASAKCPIATWSATAPPVNQLHIFCGEISNNSPKGYHSKVYAPPTDVVTSTQNETVPVNGVYDGRVNFNNGSNKFSTFFPNTCTQAHIIMSVLYAHAHPLVPQPVLPWGTVGPSAPAAGAAGYCLGSNGNPIKLRYATLGNGNINSAFPY
jgi:hypothetical protein